MKIENAIVMITGGASGLGAATAVKLAQSGAKVVILDTNLEAAKNIADSIGAIAPSSNWFFAEGYTGDSFDTWILLQNPNGSDAYVTLGFMRPDGGVITRQITVAARSRHSVHVDEVRGAEAGVGRVVVDRDEHAGRLGALAQHAEPLDGGRRASPYDFRAPDRFSKEHIRILQMIHTTLGRHFGGSLSAALRSSVQVTFARIEQSTFDNLAVRYLCADTHPDHDTICEFRRQNRALLADAFAQILELAARSKQLQVGNITVAIDGTKRLAIKRSLLAEVKRRRRSQAMIDLIASWEAEDGPIDAEHLAWADAVLDRQGVDR